MTPTKAHLEPELSSDPDNTPPRSRLFLVCPKAASAAAIQEALAAYADIEYIKTDLIAAKGVVFVKFSRSSAALAAMEGINASGVVATYRVKCMLAEPKVKRGRLADGRPAGAHDMFSPMAQGGHEHSAGGARRGSC